jgi:uncharacterized protein (TIGR02246 family)
LNPERASDEKAIRELVAAFTRAFNAADADAVAATFTDDAQVVDEHGKAFLGRDAIRGRFAQAFANNPGAVLALEVRSLRFPGPETAVEHGTATLHLPESSEPPEVSPYTVVYVKRGGRWLHASVEDHPAPPEDPSGTNESRLKEVAWLVGEWVNEGPEAVVLTSCRWDESKNYLLQDFTIKAVGKPVLSGTQRIGWDPARKQIRSWVFDNDGGFAESFWSRDAEGRWVIHASGTRRDGRVAEATRLLTRLDPHRVRFESIHRTLGGVAEPDGVAFVMVHKPPAPSAPGASPKPAKPR